MDSALSLVRQPRTDENSLTWPSKLGPVREVAMRQGALRVRANKYQVSCGVGATLRVSHHAGGLVSGLGLGLVQAMPGSAAMPFLALLL